jgi:hypothetical protein
MQADCENRSGSDVRNALASIVIFSFNYNNNNTGCQELAAKRLI